MGFKSSHLLLQDIGAPKELYGKGDGAAIPFATVHGVHFDGLGAG
jgi:hypothetical protein